MNQCQMPRITNQKVQGEKSYSFQKHGWLSRWEDTKLKVIYSKRPCVQISLITQNQ